MMDDVISCLREFMENEARSCSLDFGCVTPLYVYRMWGGQFSMEEIENGLSELRKNGLLLKMVTFVCCNLVVPRYLRFVYNNVRWHAKYSVPLPVKLAKSGYASA